MLKKRIALGLFSGMLILALVGGSVSGAEMDERSKPIQVKVHIKNAKGKKIGKAVLTQLESGVKVHVEVSGLKPGLHGIHFHEHGQCTPPDFKSAGEHFNPTHKHHGLLNPEGPHAGDLPNLVVDERGNGRMNVFTRLVTLKRGEPNSLLKKGGTALMIHADPDDEKTDPAGNSGARIACGVIR